VTPRVQATRESGSHLFSASLLQGARPSFADETLALFGLEAGDAAAAAAGAGEHPARPSIDAARIELDRLLPGRGDLAARYAAFDRQFLVRDDRLPAVLSRAIAGCRAATRAHLDLPAGERVNVAYVHDLPWSALTRYEGRFVSRVQVNVAMPLTVDRALDLACHEAYPGHHTIAVLLDARFGETRPEFFVQPLFSMQSALHEAASSLAPALAFPEAARASFERDELFPKARSAPGLDLASLGLQLKERQLELMSQTNTKAARQRAALTFRMATRGRTTKRPAAKDAAAVNLCRPHPWHGLEVGPAPESPPIPPGLILDRVFAYLIVALGRLIAGAPADEMVALARLGCTVDEALSRLEKFLDESTVTDQQVLRIIHGHGTGQLRRAVADFLKEHPLVARFQAAKMEQGGGGVTVVELKD